MILLFPFLVIYVPTWDEDGFWWLVVLRCDAEVAEAGLESFHVAGCELAACRNVVAVVS